MATKKNEHAEVLKWAESQVRIMKKSQAKNKKDQTVVTIIMAIINLAIISMATAALIILIEHKNQVDNQSAIVMASIAAGLTIAIFFVNMINIIYRSVMRWQTYKNAADAIQHEIARFHLHDEYRRYKNPEQKFIEKIKAIDEEANHTKRKKKFLKILLKALSGGDNV